MRMFRRYGWIVFVAFAVLGTMFGVFPGGWFEDDVDRDATLLTSTYGMVAVALTVAIAVTAFRRGEMWAWLAFWVWPVFFVIHGFAFFAFDFVFAALGAFSLAATYPDRSPARESGMREAAVADATE
jgi:drug/metabolite transporter (DMT)-like permease